MIRKSNAVRVFAYRCAGTPPPRVVSRSYSQRSTGAFKALQQSMRKSERGGRREESEGPCTLRSQDEELKQGYRLTNGSFAWSHRMKNGATHKKKNKTQQAQNRHMHNMLSSAAVSCRNPSLLITPLPHNTIIP